MTRRKQVSGFMEGISRLSFWALFLSFVWGMVEWMRECLSNTQIPIYIRLAIGFGVIFTLSLFSSFVLDDEMF